MLDGYVSEKEQMESIKNWWKEHGKFIAIAIVIGLVLGFGWRYWRVNEIKRAENASQIYQSVLDADAQNKFVTAQGGAGILMKKFSGSPYASLAALLWAKEAVIQKQLPIALSKLQWVINNAKEARMKQMARLSSARILLSQGKAQAALAMLKTVDDKQFLPLVHWVKGSIYTQMGQATLAKKNFQQAKNTLMSSAPAVVLMNMNLSQPIGKK